MIASHAYDGIPWISNVQYAPVMEKWFGIAGHTPSGKDALGNVAMLVRIYTKWCSTELEAKNEVQRMISEGIT